MRDVMAYGHRRLVRITWPTIEEGGAEVGVVHDQRYRFLISAPEAL